MAEAPRTLSGPLHRFVDLCTRRPVGVLMLVSVVGVFGAISFLRLPMDLMPDVSHPTITVRTSYPGAAPEDVEERVARRLEQSLSVVKNLRRITSTSRAESCDVLLEFTWDNDPKGSLQEVREKLDQTQLPEEVEPPTILRYDPNLDPVLQIGLVGEVDPKRLRELAEEEVERRLESVQGIAAVQVRGGLEEEIRVAVREDLIRSRGITLDEIARRLAEENLDQTSGLLTEGDVTYVVRTQNRIGEVEEIGGLAVRREGDSVVRLADVAEVYTTHRDEQVITRIDGKPAVKIEVFREAGANIVDLSRRVRLRLYGTPEEQERLDEWRRSVAAGTPTDVKKDPGADAASGDSKSDGGRGPGRRGFHRGPSGEGGDAGARVLARPDYIGAYLPDKVSAVVLSDQSSFIDGAVDDLVQTALLGGVLAVGVLYLFLGRFAYTMLVALCIPLSVLATFAPMYLGGISLNIMSLGGLALGVGMLVDASIVVLESIFRKREEGLPPFAAAVEGTAEVASGVIATVLTTVAVFFPIAFVEGMAGQVFRDQALTVVYSLMASLAVALSVTPMLAARLGRADAGAAAASDGGAERAGRPRWFGFWWPVSPGRFVSSWRALARIVRGRWLLPRWVAAAILLPILLAYCLIGILLELAGYLAFICWFIIAILAVLLLRATSWLADRSLRPYVRLFGRGYGAFERAYGRVLELSLVHRGGVIAVALASFVVALWLARGLGTDLVPEVAQGEFVVHVRYPVGTHLESTDARVRPYEERLGAIPGVATVATTIGVDPEDVEAAEEGEHTARFQMRLVRSGRSLAELERSVIARVAEICGGVADHTLQIARPVLFTFRTPIEVEVRGYNLETLRALGREVERLLADVPGLTNVRSNVARGNPEYHLIPDREKLAKYGLTGQAIAEVLREKNMGEVATRFRRGERRIDIRVQADAEDRGSIDDILALGVAPSDGGGGWTLRDLLSGYEVREGPSEIRRIHQQRAVVVTAEFEGLDLGGAARAIEETLGRKLDLPAEYSAEVVGQKQEMEESIESLIQALALAIFLVYVVMAVQFESIVQPLIILFTIPLSAVGVVFTLLATGASLSVMSFIGMIVLVGIVVDNAIILLDLVNRLRARGHSVHEALLVGSCRRLRPILMTTLTTALGMLPMTGVLSGIPHGAGLDWLLGSGEGAEIRAPLAWTFIGGLASSTLLTLVVIPVVYSLVSRWRWKVSMGDGA